MCELNHSCSKLARYTSAHLYQDPHNWRNSSLHQIWNHFGASKKLKSLISTWSCNRDPGSWMLEEGPCLWWPSWHPEWRGVHFPNTVQRIGSEWGTSINVKTFDQVGRWETACRNLRPASLVLAQKGNEMPLRHQVWREGRCSGGRWSLEGKCLESRQVPWNERRVRFKTEYHV